MSVLYSRTYDAHARLQTAPMLIPVAITMGSGNKSINCGRRELLRVGNGWNGHWQHQSCNYSIYKLLKWERKRKGKMGRQAQHVKKVSHRAGPTVNSWRHMKATAEGWSINNINNKERVTFTGTEQYHCCSRVQGEGGKDEGENNVLMRYCATSVVPCDTSNAHKEMRTTEMKLHSTSWTSKRNDNGVFKAQHSPKSSASTIAVICKRHTLSMIQFPSGANFSLSFLSST